jgi:hypothetical protein
MNQYFLKLSSKLPAALHRICIETVYDITGLLSPRSINQKAVRVPVQYINRSTPHFRQGKSQ